MKKLPDCALVSPDDWADACGRICTIDGFELTGKAILIAVRKPSDIPECGEFAKALAQSCNDLIRFASRHPRVIGERELIDLCVAVNRRLIAGAMESKMLNEGREGRRVAKDAPPDGVPPFTPEAAWKMLEDHSALLTRVAAEMVPGDGTGYLPLEVAQRAGGFAYTFPFDMATVCPFGALNGMTGRLVAEAVRLRLRFPFFGFQMTRAHWSGELVRHRERGYHFSEFSIIPVAEMYGNVV